MEYGLTNSLIKRLKLNNVEKPKETDMLYVWEATYRDICGKKVLLIMHADTKYCMVFTDIKPSVWKNFTSFMNNAIAFALKIEGFTSQEIVLYFNKAKNVSLTATHGRKTVGGLNKTVMDMECIEKTLVNGMYQPIISEDLNDLLHNDPYRKENTYIVPKEFFRKQMSNLLRN